MSKKKTLIDFNAFHPKRAIGWWLFKRSMAAMVTRGFLSLSVLAAAVGLGFWGWSINKVPLPFLIGGAVVGLLVLGLGLRSLLRFRATIASGVIILLVGAGYLAISLYYILNHRA